MRDMKQKLLCLLPLPLLLSLASPVGAQANLEWQKYVPLIKQTLSKDYENHTI
jgi:hypothetical protein